MVTLYNMMDNGILYCATTAYHLQQAALSAKSVKTLHPNLPCAICTPLQVNNAIFDKVIKTEKQTLPASQYVLPKVQALQKSPFKKTLYLDCDTYLVDDISDLFVLLNRFDFAFAHGHERNYRYNLQTGKTPFKNKTWNVVRDIPYSFAPVQSGVILYKINDKVSALLKQWEQLYIEKQYFDDQASLRELLWSTELNFYVLPREYNFNNISFLTRNIIENNRVAKPKIFHYTTQKHRNIERLVKRTTKRKYYLQKFWYKLTHIGK